MTGDTVPIRYNISIGDELKDMVVADLVLIFAFSFTVAGGIGALASDAPGFVSAVAYFAPIAALGVTLSFILHELMHKFVAQHYGAIAGFRTSRNGLMITLITGAFGFLLGIPGATMIYTSGFTKREDGIVSIAGPLTNFVVFAVFLAALLLARPAPSSYLNAALSYTLFISIFLAFFNMLPIPPLDGSKVLRWSKPVYFATIGAIFALMVKYAGIPLSTVAYMLFVALIFSLFYRVTI